MAKNFSGNGGATGVSDPASYPSSDQLERSCDLVMKGGITSGVIYPQAVCQLAMTRRIRRVGGTSAGAIAAGAAAAAELGRESDGFVTLAGLPSWLASKPSGRHTNLFHLFQAQRATRALYRFVAVFIGRGGVVSKSSRALLFGALLLRPLPLLLLVGLSVLLLVVAVVQGGWAGIVAAALFVVLAGVVAFVWSMWIRLRNDLVENHLGLCTGMPGSGGGDRSALTVWLSDVYDNLAGRTDPSRPLTFGNLVDGDVEAAMFTTNLTLSTQDKLPFTTRVWAFDPEEFRDLFPERIVRWMVDHPPEPRNVDDTQVFAAFRDAGLAPLPDERDLPLVVGVRMSLSFPLLLSTVPLHAFDYTRSDPRLVRHRFSDGGITSNFPLQFFDQAIPDHPTFAINLKGVTRVDPDEADNVSMPAANRSGILARSTGVESFGQFVAAVADTLQNWADSMQTHVPGYRDRIVAVEHTKEEGGMNLDMDESVVLRLAERGRCAGERADGFDFSNHRWVRFRSFLQVMEDVVRPAAATLDDSEPQGDVPTYREMIAGRPPDSYRELWTADSGTKIADSILELAEAYETALMDDGRSRFERGAPSPKPEFQIRPRP